MRRTISFLFLLLFCSNLVAVSSKFVYNTLSQTDKILYNLMDEAILNCEKEIDATSYSKEDCLRIYSNYLDDHPGVFWVDSMIRYTTSLNSEGKINHSILFSYTHQENLHSDQASFINLVEHFHEFIKNDNNDWIKVFHIYDYLASTIVYDNNYDDQSMWSVFFDGVGVCMGFARSFQYLALLEGIPSLIVSGYERRSDGSPGTVRHAWCMAQIEGNWYHFDPTWGIRDSKGNVDYSFFCRSQNIIEKTHVIDNAYPLPASEDDGLSYVRLRNRFIEDYSYDNFTSIVKSAFEIGSKLITVEFSSETVLNKAIKKLVMEKELSLIFKKIGIEPTSYEYSYNLRTCTLTLYFNF